MNISKLSLGHELLNDLFETDSEEILQFLLSLKKKKKYETIHQVTRRGNSVRWTPMIDCKAGESIDIKFSVDDQLQEIIIVTHTKDYL